MIFSWKLQLDYDLLVLSPNSVRIATKSWYKCTSAFYIPPETYMETG